VVNDDGSMARLPQLVEFCQRHDLCLITIADLIAFRRRSERQVERIVETRIPTKYGDFTAFGYRSIVDGREHLALVSGDIGDGEASSYGCTRNA